MKKWISLLLMFVLLLSSFSVFAATEDSAKMQEVLLKVKEKITIPVELTEFSGSVSEYNKKISYYFDWTSPDYEKSISVSCDEQGRITSYYQNINKVSDKRLSGIPKAELIAFAESFLRTTIPEAFISETDLLVYDEESYYASGNLSYHLEFVRRKDDVKVKDNYVNVYLSVVDGEIQVRNMELSFDYDAEFSAPQEDVENYQEKYQELFPAELIYRDEYKLVIKENEPHFTPVLV